MPYITSGIRAVTLNPEGNYVTFTLYPNSEAAKKSTLNPQPQG